MANSYIPREQDDEGYDDKARAALGAKIAGMILALGWNQSDLARAAGLRRDAISTYCKGKVWPNPQSFNAVARALGITPLELRPTASEIEEVVARPANEPTASRVPLPPRNHAARPAANVSQVRPGIWRVSVDQEMPADHAMRIFAILNELAK